MKQVLAAAFAIAITASAAGSWAAPAMNNATGHKPPPLESHTMVPLVSHTLTPDEGEGEVLERRAALKLEREALRKYYTQKMETASGTITQIDEAGATISIRNDSGETMTFSFDENTRFQVMLKPVELAKLRTGAKIVCLYQQKDGRLYLGRLMAL